MSFNGVTATSKNGTGRRNWVEAQSIGSAIRGENAKIVRIPLAFLKYAYRLLPKAGHVWFSNGHLCSSTSLMLYQCPMRAFWDLCPDTGMCIV